MRTSSAHLCILLILFVNIDIDCQHLSFLCIVQYRKRQSSFTDHIPFPKLSRKLSAHDPFSVGGTVIPSFSGLLQWELQSTAHPMEIHLIGYVGSVPKLMKEVAGEDKPVILPHPPLQLNSLSLWKNSPDKDTLVPFDKESSAY